VLGILLGMAGDQVEQGTVNMTRGDWEQSMEILLGMAGDQEEQGTVNMTRGDREQSVPVLYTGVNVKYR
jgi:hypothetical protein